LQEIYSKWQTSASEILGLAGFRQPKQQKTANDWKSSNDSAATCRHGAHGTDLDTTKITIYQYMNNLRAIGAQGNSMEQWAKI
jgi:hypothetical protein